MSQYHRGTSVSVITSIYNNAGYLPQAIESILAQTFADFEFLIVNDASTDESSDILAAYARQDHRISCFHNAENCGLTRNLNFLLNQAQGQFIARMDGDDISHPSRLAEEMQVMMGGDVDLVWTNAIFIDEANQEICVRYQPSLEYTLAKLSDKFRWGNYIVHPAVMFKRQSALNVGGYNEAYRSGQDGDLWMRLKAHGGRFALIDKSLLSYRLDPNSITTKRLGYTDMNSFYAYMCLVNRQPEKSWPYLKKVRSPLQKLYLMTRWLVGEDTFHFLKIFRLNNYNKIHQWPA